MNILIADDDPVTLNLLSTRLDQWGHTVHQATDGSMAWEIIRGTAVDMVVSHWRVAGPDGVQLCRAIRDRHASGDIYLILIGARDSREEVVRKLEGGADDYLAKPIDMATLRARIDIGVRVVNLERSLKRKNDIITATHHQTIGMFSRTIAFFDPDLGEHCRRTSEVAMELARRHPDVADTAMPVIETAALLHDIGMIGSPRSIMNKRRTEMVDGERRLYQSHPESGAHIIEVMEIMKPAALLVRMHHEQYNGKGFPEGLAGDEIPIGAQLISAASIYDNMRHRGNIRLDRIAENLQRIRGYQLSPRVVALLLEFNIMQQYDQARKTEQEQHVDDLEAGMILAANVHLKTGAFVLAADTALDDHEIDKLKHYHAIGAIIGKVLIRTASARK